MADPRRVIRSDPLHDGAQQRAEQSRAIFDALYDDWRPVLPDDPFMTRTEQPSVQLARREQIAPRRVHGNLASRPAAPMRNTRPITNKERSSLGKAVSNKQRSALALSEKTLKERASRDDLQARPSSTTRKDTARVNCKEKPEKTKRTGKGGSSRDYVPWCDRRH